jgi:long-chain acyl-CoA synthetase
MLSVFIPMRAHYMVNFVESPDTVTQNMTEVSPSFMLSVPRIWEKYFAGIFIRMKDATLLKKMTFGLARHIGKKYAEARLDSSRGQKVPLWLRAAFSVAHFTVFRKLKERLGFERLRVVFSAAAPISPDLLRFYHSIGIPLRQIYGQTEDSGPTSGHVGEIIEPDNTGPPIPGVEVKIAPDGEILVKGPNVFLGYFKNPQATADTLREGWLHSGDVGELTEQGFLKITDRKKDLIITSGGKNVAPQYIENQLKFSPYINDAVIIGDGRKFLAALIVIDEDMVIKYAQDNKIQFTTFTSLTEAPEVIKLIDSEVQQVNKNLARVEQIKKFRMIPKKLYEEDGEVTPTMKVKRKHINARYKDLIEGMYGRA